MGHLAFLHNSVSCQSIFTTIIVAEMAWPFALLFMDYDKALEFTLLSHTPSYQVCLIHNIIHTLKGHILHLLMSKTLWILSLAFAFKSQSHGIEKKNASSWREKKKRWGELPCNLEILALRVCFSSHAFITLLQL